MNRIKLVDCTLRDGGYINNWKFGHESIKDIVTKLTRAKIDVVEIGFLQDKAYDKDKTIFSDFMQIEAILPSEKKISYCAMSDMNDPFPLDKIPMYDGKSIDSIRVIFKKKMLESALLYCQKIQEKGYKVFFQLVSTDAYSDIEYVEVIQKVNIINPYAFSIVDTFGLIKKKDFLRLVYLADNNLNKNIALGYHSHNNLQQAFGNAEAMTEVNMERIIYIDACVFGMGRGAGNLNLELFAEYMNENYHSNYQVEPMLEIMDEYLSDIYRHSFWGYSLPFYLSATTGTHPNYASYIAQKGNLSAKSFHELLRTIPNESKSIYSDQIAEKIYVDYLQNYIDDKQAVSELKSIFENRTVVLLAPGASIGIHQEKINTYVKKNEALLVALNFYSDIFPIDYIFSSDMRRYHKLEHLSQVKKIISSNIKEAEFYEYKINFSSIACEAPEIIENTGIIFLNLMKILLPKNIVLAGFDGYSERELSHYFTGLEFNFSAEVMKKRNELIAAQIAKQSKSLPIEFLTPSQYQQL